MFTLITKCLYNTECPYFKRYLPEYKRFYYFLHFINSWVGSCAENSQPNALIPFKNKGFMRNTEVIWVSERNGRVVENKIDLSDRRVLILKMMLKEEGTIYERLRKVSSISYWTWLKLDVALREIESGDVREMIKYAIGLCLIEV